MRLGQAAVARVDPFEMLADIDEAIVYLCRYMRPGDVADIEAQPLDRVRSWIEITSKYIRAEAGIKEDGKGFDDPDVEYT